MVNPNWLRNRLEWIKNATAPSVGLAPTAYWEGDKAEERRVQDDMDSGRLSWSQAHDFALDGLRAIDAGNLEIAESLLWHATGYFIEAVWSRTTPADIAFLSNSAAQRGRSKTTQGRDAKLSRAVTEQEGLGLKGKAARRAALSKNPDLEAAFFGMSDAALVKAIQRARNKRA